MSINLATLKTEITTDPRGYGYAAPLSTAADGGLANILNVIRDGSPGTVPTSPTAAGGSGDGKISVKRADVSPNEIIEAIDIRDFVAAPPGVNNNQLAASWFESMSQLRTVRLVNDAGTNTRVFSNIQRLLANGSASETRLNAVSSRPASRAEELFGAGTVVSAQDVEAARNS